jgi:hypothetical protein
MRAHKVGEGHWVIGRNFRTLDVSGTSGTYSHAIERTRLVYESWTGEWWWMQTATALAFATDEEATTYLEANRERLEESR